MKKNLESEISYARDEYQKLESHIKLYINQMEQAIGESEGRNPGAGARRKPGPVQRRTLARLG